MTQLKMADKLDQRPATSDQPVLFSKSSQDRKVLIVTLFFPHGNYGSTLQHYALQETVKSLGFSTYSIFCTRESRASFTDILYRFVRLCKITAKIMLAVAGNREYRRKIIMKLTPHSVEAKKHYEGAEERSEIFRDFYDKFIDGKIYSSFAKVMSGEKSQWVQYDYVVTGSDQVWNRAWCVTSEGLRFYYLQFVERSQRVSYAPSFGLRSLPFIDLPLHKKGLRGFNRLSCREVSGCEIIKRLTNLDAQLVLDPTLLLEAAQWRKLARKPSYDVPENYALVYLLGADNEYYRTIRKTVIEKSAEGRKLIDISGYSSGNEYYYHTGPQEFLWLVDNADYVFTNSFHGTVFSINFGKNFTSFWKERKGHPEDITRLDNILSNCGLNDRLYTPENVDVVGTAIDYGTVFEKLAIMRESSLNYLRQCLM
ncbi:MAG: polysaccharide pyruvyl transferase family protein [Synergistaceae bacterium]|nr:polysaccharide pyruvyl transferase family protein [Synergistaceae bacterium]